MTDRSRSAGPPVLGVVGTLVWDTIHRREGLDDTTEEWGGIGYVLEALTAVLPEPWEVLPLVKVGRDLAEEAFRFLRGPPRVRVEPGVVVVSQPNNQVELRYDGLVRQAERLTGGVPPWRWDELRPLAGLCDAIYVNFVSGFEMELETARSLRAGYDGPIYADLHSLFLGIGRHGDRIPRPLPHWAEWLRSFDAVQMNEREFELLGRASGDPWRLAADAVGPDLKLIAITLAGRGAAYVATEAFRPDPFSWEGSRGWTVDPGTTRSARIPPAGGEREGGDPTGCGDVWGASFFAGLLGGASLEEAMGEANRMAATNMGHRGARGLGLHLAGRVDPGGGGR